jgi:MerR family mercuric resistance operon transcriptional regulator
MKLRNGAGRLLIGALSERTRVNIETIRYYERIGLLPRPQRTPGRHRLYGSNDIKVLNFIRHGRELGFSLNDIRALLTLANATSPCRTAKAITDRHLTDIRAKLVRLTKLDKALTTMANRCRPDTSSSCPILDALADDTSLV